MPVSAAARGRAWRGERSRFRSRRRAGQSGRRTRPRDPPPAGGAKRWALFLDLDGTLLAIADAPDRVQVNAGLRALIRVLRRALGGAVALVSGRDVADVERLFPRLRLSIAGLHGIERRDAHGVLHRGRVPRILSQLRARLVEAAGRHAGLLLEDKQFALALHYRRAPRLAGFAHRLVAALAAKTRGRFQLQRGKRVAELRPTGCDKGTAIGEFMRESPFRGRTPVFVGDDATDECGFMVVNREYGISVKVGPGRTCARWRLRDVAAVHAWLGCVLDGVLRERGLHAR